MKKKLFATLGALCLGVILCVSSVFAVNWWYSINNTAGTTTITMGQKTVLTVSGAGGTADGVYQNSQVTFNAINVEVPDWTPNTVTGNVQHTQTEFPTYKLTLGATVQKKVDGVLGEAAEISSALDFVKVTVTVVSDGTATGVSNVSLVNGLDIVTDIDADATVTVALVFDDDIDAEYAEAVFAFTVTVVDEEGGTHL